MLIIVAMRILRKRQRASGSWFIHSGVKNIHFQLKCEFAMDEANCRPAGKSDTSCGVRKIPAGRPQANHSS